MEPKVFGAFVQARRKELGLTQLELAEKLNVTAKAVSRWERGVGFPDIQLLQPLADGLQISLLELMQSRRIEEDISVAEAETMVSEVVDTLQAQQNESWKTKALLWIGYVTIFAAYLFLGYVARTYLFHSFRLYFPMVLIYVVIYHYGIPIWKAIVTGTPVQVKELKAPPLTWRAALSLVIFFGGLALVLFAMARLEPKSNLHDALVVTGLFSSIFGGAYYYQYTGSHREKK